MKKVQHLGGLGFKDGAEAGILWNFTFLNWPDCQFWLLGGLDVKDREKRDILLDMADWQGFNKNQSVTIAMIFYSSKTK